MSPKILSLATALSLAFACSASNEPIYHAPAFFGLKGPVKEVKYTSGADKSVAISNTEEEGLKFGENGAIITEKDNYTYDEDGYIVSFQSVFNDVMPCVRKAIYDDCHLLTGYISEISDPIAIESVSTDSFDEEGNVVKTFTTSRVKDEKLKTILPPGGMPDTICTYTDIETDSHGNWIKRKVTVRMDSDLPNNCLDELLTDQTEQRTITYY